MYMKNDYHDGKTQIYIAKIMELRRFCSYIFPPFVRFFKWMFNIMEITDNCMEYERKEPWEFVRYILPLLVI